METRSRRSDQKGEVGRNTEGRGPEPTVVHPKGIRALEVFRECIPSETIGRLEFNDCQPINTITESDPQ